MISATPTHQHSLPSTVATRAKQPQPLPIASLLGEEVREKIAALEHRTRELHARRKLARLFVQLLHDAKLYFQNTHRHLPIYGELGELYAELCFGIERHNPQARGSDGKIGRDFVEVKTISPLSRSMNIRVKRGGNFGKLAVVKIDPDFSIEAKLVSRKVLGKGPGKFATVSWEKVVTASSANQARAENISIAHQ